jgi:hypothetical protein
MIGNQEHYQKTGRKPAAVSTFIKDGKVYDFHKHIWKYCRMGMYEKDAEEKYLLVLHEYMYQCSPADHAYQKHMFVLLVKG